MAIRQITHVSKDQNGDITAVGSRGLWREPTSTAIFNIEIGWASYYVECPLRTEVYVAKSLAGKKFLKTRADNSMRNNLDNLPRL